MIKSISFVVLTHFFQFNQLLRQPGYLLFKLNQQYLFYSVCVGQGQKLAFAQGKMPPKQKNVTSYSIF